MEKIFSFFIFSNLLISSLSIVPIWKFTNSAIDLIEIENPYEYNIVEKKLHDDLIYILTKSIERTASGEIIIENWAKCKFDGSSDYDVDSKVSFEDIESAYTDKNQRYYICPKGRNHVFYQDTNRNIRNLTSSDFTNDNSDWELQCYYQHANKILFVFYLNKYEYIYQISVSTGEIIKIPNSKYKILSYRWTTDATDGKCMQSSKKKI